MGVFWKVILILAILYFISRVKRYFAMRRMRRHLMDFQGRGAAGSGPAETRKLEGLDASGFLPPENEQLKALGKSFGRAWLRVGWEDRTRIPSDNSPRIKLIDKAMIGLGVISEEELKEAHRLGEIVDEALGDENLAREKAEGEAFKKFEEAAAIKARKKEEAEKKREEWAEAVAHRRRTDIIYLGKGVSGDLNDRRANVERLTAAGLPVLAAPRDIASAMGIPVPKLRWLAFHSEAAKITHYTNFTVEKKSGGTRNLASPHREMAAAQQWIKDNILDRIASHEAAHGFIRGRSALTNARPHVGKELVINIDIKDFFPSITFPRIKGLFRNLGYSPCVATILALLCSECPRRKVEFDNEVHHVATGPRALPQGSRCSPALSNMIARRLDIRFEGLCKRLGWTYSRYADDITFSKAAGAKEQAGYMLARARHILEDEGFRINEGKTRVLKRSAAQTVTGLTVNDKPGIRRKDIRRIRAILHNAASRGLESQNRSDHPNFEAYLKGWIAHISMVCPEKGARLKEQLNSIGKV